MGVAAGSLLYDIGPAVEWKGSGHWQLFEGSKKDTGVERSDADRVSIFKYSKPKDPANVLTNACTRNTQKLRTIKHPFILSYIDSSVTEDSIVLVTEYAKPLDIWLTDYMREMEEQSNYGADSGGNIRNDVLWGLHCIFTALDFLHSKCKLSHNNICTTAFYVIPNGDWKIGGFDFATQPGNNDDKVFLQSASSYITSEFLSPERTKGGESGTCESDMYSISKTITAIFSMIETKVPEDLDRFMKKMNSMEAKRRPTASSVLACRDLSADYIVLLTSLNDLALKSALEVQDILQKLTVQASQLSKSICSHRILGIISQRLKIAVTEFANRDNRESSRQIIQTAVNLLATLIETGKIDEMSFRSKCLPVMNDLWAMSDRTVRHSLLKASKAIISLTPIANVNKNIFDAMLSGFADSNSKMREDTLKNLVHIVDKLEEKQLQDRLVRCITNLQNDSENSIRTNATIFLGRIASKLKEATRHRVLCQAFAKAMRDTFSHCRIAGLKSASACLEMIDVQQLATVLMPQVCVMLVDRNSEIRQLAVNFLDSCKPILRSYHDTLMKAPVEEKEDKSQTKSESQNTGTASVWASWAVDGLSKTLERVATDSAKPTTAAAVKPNVSSTSEKISAEPTVPSAGPKSPVDVAPKETLPPSLPSFGRAASFTYNDDEVDMDNKNSQWEDDDFDWNDESDTTDIKMIAPKQTVKSEDRDDDLESYDHKKDSNTRSISEKEESKSPSQITTPSKAPKPKPVKLSATKIESTDEDNWDDF